MKSGKTLMKDKNVLTKLGAYPGAVQIVLRKQIHIKHKYHN